MFFTQKKNMKTYSSKNNLIIIVFVFKLRGTEKQMYH